MMSRICVYAAVLLIWIPACVSHASTDFNRRFMVEEKLPSSSEGGGSGSDKNIPSASPTTVSWGTKNSADPGLKDFADTAATPRPIPGGPDLEVPNSLHQQPQPHSSPSEFSNPNDEKTIDSLRPPLPTSSPSQTKNPDGENSQLTALPFSLSETSNPKHSQTLPPDDIGKGSQGSDGGKRVNTVDSPEKVCHEVLGSCIRKDFVACIQYPSQVSTSEFLLVQNIGRSDLVVNITISNVTEVKQLPLTKSKSEQIEVGTSSTNSVTIYLSTGVENCTLQRSFPNFNWNLYNQLPALAMHVMALYGIYLLGFTMVFVGGAWACCKIRRRPSGSSSVPYRQLEMEVLPPQSNDSGGEANGAANGEDGWDRWEDGDWEDEESVIRPSEKWPASGNASGKGLYLRSASGNSGWDAAWDDD